MSLVALAVIVRPTAAITWFPLCVWHAYLSRHSLIKLFKQIALQGYINLVFECSIIVSKLFIIVLMFYYYIMDETGQFMLLLLSATPLVTNVNVGM